MGLVQAQARLHEAAAQRGQAVQEGQSTGAEVTEGGGAEHGGAVEGVDAENAGGDLRMTAAVVSVEHLGAAQGFWGGKVKEAGEVGEAHVQTLSTDRGRNVGSFGDQGDALTGKAGGELGYDGPQSARGGKGEGAEEEARAGIDFRLEVV